ncbi:7435_t:CDS:2 [Funneliformis mosseae]|uniref:7435_t:CDS:1 n=1 Tax=Funneliformis mosseae TaxID=27381 RepID=A0A9N9HKF1_FUNMO|nr:7435_t:CDS:2 [Funneliformis mosseae]
MHGRSSHMSKSILRTHEIFYVIVFKISEWKKSHDISNAEFYWVINVQALLRYASDNNTKTWKHIIAAASPIELD